MAEVNVLAKQCVTTMRTAAATFSGSLKADKAHPGEPHPTKAELKTLAEGVKLEASKIGLMWGSAAPSPAEAEALLRSLEHRHSQLLTLMYRAGNGAGPTLLRSLRNSAAPVTEACIGLIHFLAGDESRAGGQAATKTGLVWAACDATSTCSLDNKTALGRELLVISKRVKDNACELKELVDNPPSSDDHPNAPNGFNGAADSSSDSGDLDFAAQAVSPAEHAVATAAVPLLDAVLELCKCLLRMLVKQDKISSSLVDSWESLLFHFQKLAEASNDLGAAMYSPQDRQEITDIVDSLEVSFELIADEIPDEVRIEHQDAVDTVARQFSLALTVVAECLRQHRQVMQADCITINAM